MPLTYFRWIFRVACGFLLVCSSCTLQTRKPVQRPPACQILNYDPALKQTADGWLYKGKPFSGYMIQKERNDRIVYQLPIVNGKENGLATGCYSTGEKLVEQPYYDGKKEGIFKQWWPNGNYRYLFRYEDNKLEGPQLVFYPDGKKRQEINYSHGQEEGFQHTWNEQGILISNFTIRNKKLYGLVKVRNCISLAH